MQRIIPAIVAVLLCASPAFAQQQVVEASAAAILAAVTTANDQTDTLESSLDGVEGLLTSIRDYVSSVATYVDDEDWTALSSTHMLTGCLYQASPGSITNGDTGPYRCNINGYQLTQPLLLDSGGDNMTSNPANAIRVLAVDAVGSSSANALDQYISVGTNEDEHQTCSGACTFISIEAYNNHASSNAFIKCTNNTAAGTVPGSTTVVYRALIPYGLPFTDFPDAAMSVGLTCYAVLGEADSATDEVAANDVAWTIRYR